MSEKEELKLGNVRPDGVETLEGGLENYHEQQEEEQKEEFSLTFEEKKKLLRAMRKKQEEFPMPVTDEDVDALTDEQLEELKDFAKFQERRAIYKYVNRVKSVDDITIENLTDEEIDDMIAKSYVMANHFSYNPKKHYGTAYKKKRQNRNKMAKASRRRNR